MLLDGYGAVGQGAHEAEISYLKILGFAEIDVQFANQIRFFRNWMLYYGTILDKIYAQATKKRHTLVCYPEFMLKHGNQQQQQ